MSTQPIISYALGILLTACAASTEPGGRTPTASDVEVLPSAATLTVGQTAQFMAMAFDRNGNAVTGGVPVWSTSDSRIVAIAPSGMVTAVAAGTASVTATVNGSRGTAAITVIANSLDVTIENQLIYPVTVGSGGTVLGTVQGQTTQRLTVSGLAPGAAVDWELVRPVVVGRSIGDPMAGTFAPTSGVTGSTRLLVINNLIGSDYYFAPVINNLTGTDLLMAVNYQLAAENRCNCVVAAGRMSVAIGYYRLYSNSNVTAFRSGSSYTGSYYYFYNFGLSIPVGSGLREFNYTVSP